MASVCSLVLPFDLNALELLGNFSVRLGGVKGRLAESMSVARWIGSIPPKRREMLNSERLPQTRHWSCGLSLTTSHSAHNTAFCKEIEFSGRSSSARILIPELFILTPQPKIDCTESGIPHKEKQGMCLNSVLPMISTDNEKGSRVKAWA